MAQLPTWLTPSLQTFLTVSLAKYQEIPEWIYPHAPQAAESYAQEYESRIIPSSQNVVLSLEKSLLDREVDFLRRRLDHYDSINLFDIYEVSGDSSLPFIIELLEAGQMGKYTPISVNRTLGKMAQHRIESYLEESKIGSITYDSLVANPALGSFHSLVKDVQNTSESQNTGTSCNLFMLLNSCLGNFQNPKQIIRNISDSMQEGDYLVILQGIYRLDSENQLISDYTNWFTDPTAYQATKEIASAVSGGSPLQIEWEENSNTGFKGIKVRVQTQESQQINSLELDDKENLTIFRSQRFEEEELRIMCKQANLHLIDMAYDRGMDNTLMFLQK